MKNEFIPYEEALALKELGFDEKCFASWWNDQLVTDYIDQEEIDALSRPSAMSKNYSYMLAPLYQQAFRWFREEHGITSHIASEASLSETNVFYHSFVIGFNKSNLFLSEQETQNACLKRLIKLVKLKEDEIQN